MTKFLESMRGWNWHEVLLTALIVAGAWLSGRLLVWLGRRVGGRLLRRADSPLAYDVLVGALHPTAWLVSLVGVYLALHRYRFGLLQALDGVLYVISVMLVTHLAGKVLGAALRSYAQRGAQGCGDEKLAAEMIPFADRLGRLALLGLGLLVALDHFHIEIRSILVTLGVGSLAIGLALQETLANMFGGFAILVDRPFRVGDRVVLATGETGDVQEIGLRSTRILTLDHHMLIVPNSTLVKTTVTNLSLPNAQSVLQVQVALAADADVEQARRLMLEAARDAAILTDPAPSVFLRGLEDSLPRLLLICRVASFEDRLTAADRLNRGILESFRAAGVRMANPAAPVVQRAGP
ncbi:MAG: mechanosensitive ion channel family protein [Candidatus Eisenbacteria bacterium]|nr:mechanosensitive ion channel family protein [Candidatus Eisenbacteria bacterium]